MIYDTLIGVRFATICTMADHMKEPLNRCRRKMIHMKKGNLIKNLICGIAIGAGAILPGISAGVLCVIFGVYKPLMEALSHPIQGLRKNWKMFLPIGIGWLIGFFLFAKLIEWIFQISELYSTWLFVGLIMGTVPALYKEAGEKGRTKASYISMIVTGVALVALLTVIKYVVHFDVTPNTGWFVFAGVLWGLSFIVPGLSSSPMLLALGLYDDLNSGLANLNIGILIPWLIGMIVTMLLLARLMNYFFKKHESIAYHAVVGIVAASTLMIIPLKYDSVSQIFVGLIFGAVGYIIAFISEKLDLKVKGAE